MKIKIIRIRYTEGYSEDIFGPVCSEEDFEHSLRTALIDQSRQVFLQILYADGSKHLINIRKVAMFSLIP